MIGMWGSLPVVDDQQSRKLIGMITDRDLCCTVLAEATLGHYVAVLR